MKCEQCGKEHLRPRFCSNKCKDRWHNTHNPRGIATPPDPALAASIMNDEILSAGMDAIEDGWDGHKNAF